MSFKIGIAGLPNSGKSYSRKTIPDGENVFIIAPSQKVTYLKTSDGKQLEEFDMATAKYANMKAAVAGLNLSSELQVIKTWNAKLKPGSLTPDMLKGNIKLIKDMEHLPFYIEFVSKHLPWIHTLILPDFTHHISNVISQEGFINRKAGGDAYQKFWELAGTALRNFILSLDDYRNDLLIVTEYHAAYDEKISGFEIFVPAGKMLTEKFLPPSYYDFLLFTDIKWKNEGEEDESAQYRFVTRATKKYPQARAMNLFETTYIENDLNLVLNTFREHQGIPLPSKSK